MSKNKDKKTPISYTYSNFSQEVSHLKKIGEMCSTDFGWIYTVICLFLRSSHFFGSTIATKVKTQNSRKRLTMTKNKLCLFKLQSYLIMVCVTLNVKKITNTEKVVRKKCSHEIPVLPYKVPLVNLKNKAF